MYNDIPEKSPGYADGFYQPLNAFMAGLRQANEKRDIPIIRKDTEMLLRSLLALQKPRNILEIGTACGYSALFFAWLLPSVRITSLEIKEAYAKEAAANIERARDYVRSAADVLPGISFDGRIRLIQGDAAVTLSQLAARAPMERQSQEERRFQTDRHFQAERGHQTDRHFQVERGYQTDQHFQKEAFDMVFMDGPKGHYLKHFELAVPLMAEKVMVISDNILLGGMMTGEAAVSRRNMTMVRRMNAYLQHITNLPDFETSVLALGDGMALSYRGFTG